MKVDMHNHTYLCNHADGKPEEYLKAAISKGIDIFGFSDHAPMNFDKAYRMSFSQMDFYENLIDELKEKFQGKIEILKAYEVDFLPGFIDERVISRKVDYLIGSVHFLNAWGFDNPKFIGGWKDKNIDEIYSEYFSAIENLAKSGKFDILGHLDLIKVFKFLPKKDIRILAKSALNAIKKADLTVELNSAGLRKPVKEIYPSDALLEQIAELEIKITLSSDAHSPEQVAQNYDEILKTALKFGFNKVAIFKNRDRKFVDLG